MSTNPHGVALAPWRVELPALTARLVTLREVTPEDISAIIDLLSVPDASNFGLDVPVRAAAVERLLADAPRARAAGTALTWAVVAAGAPRPVGLMQVRQLEPSFETAEWECTLSPFARGTGVFLESARLAGSFAFAIVGAYRIEARVLLQNGRANGALRKLGAVQEGVLRRAVRRGGEYYDQVLWSVLKDDWTARWASPFPRIH
ncbi:MAG: GNAT family N-acetyltransferase [Betaproteobacteria bacterium]